MFSEESRRVVHELGNSELHELGQISRTVQCQSCLMHIPEGLVFCSCGMCLRQGEEQIQRIKARFEAMMVPWCLARVNYPRGERQQRSSITQKRWKQWMPEEEPERTNSFHRAQMAEGRKVSRISESSWMGRRLLPIPGRPHDGRHLLKRNLAPVEPVRKHHRPGIRWWWSPSWIDASTKHFKTDYSKSCISSTRTRTTGRLSSEERESMPKTIRWSVAGRPGLRITHVLLHVETEHLVARTFFSVSRTCDHHTHLRVAQGLTAHVWDVLHLCAYEKPSTHNMFHRPLRDVPDPLPSFCSTPPPSTPTALPMTRIKRSPCATRRGGL